MSEPLEFEICESAPHTYTPHVLFREAGKHISVFVRWSAGYHPKEQDAEFRAEAMAMTRRIAEVKNMVEALRELAGSAPLHDASGVCLHCGRDNQGEDQSRCAYDGPQEEGNCPWEEARAILARIDEGNAA